MSLLTNHGRVLLYVAAQPVARERDIAAVVGITERATQRIVNELATAGYIDRRRNGRRNVYQLNGDSALRDPICGGHTVREFVELVGRPADAERCEVV
jgi:predicted transcriptional regulator